MSFKVPKLKKIMKKIIKKIKLNEKRGARRTKFYTSSSKTKDINILIITNIYNLDCTYLCIPPSTTADNFRLSF